jgi:ABC-2 family transporter protein
MSTVLFVRRFAADYARNPVNLLLLALVPAVFVVVAAGSLADAARLLGGRGGLAVETNTAGWAAGFLAGIAMYFQVSTARDADRRLVLSGLPAGRLVAARLLTGMLLAAFAAAAALAALAARTGIGHLGRAVAGTLMFAVVYLAIGGLVGARVRNPVNGTVLVLFVWILDIFLGPTMGAADRTFTRPLPSHFASLWMVDLPSGHAGRVGDLGWALSWTAGALLVAWAVTVAGTRVAHPRAVVRRPGSLADQLGAGLRMGLRDYRRNPVLWVLLVVVPAVFVLLADAVTPDKPIVISTVEAGRTVSRAFSMVRVHGATMAPVAVASLAALAGLFILLDARSGDRRLALAGFRPGRLLGCRLAVVGLAALLATAISLGVTALVFDARRWDLYIAANLLIAGSYALLGVLLGPILGRVGGGFVAFLIPFLDLGIAQSPMLRSEPAGWARLLPGYGGSRVLLDGALTADFDTLLPLLAGLGWLAALTLAAALVFRHGTHPMQTVRAVGAGGGAGDEAGGADGGLPGSAGRFADRRAAGRRGRQPDEAGRGVEPVEERPVLQRGG